MVLQLAGRVVATRWDGAAGQCRDRENRQARVCNSISMAADVDPKFSGAALRRPLSVSVLYRIAG